MLGACFTLDFERKIPRASIISIDPDKLRLAQCKDAGQRKTVRLIDRRVHQASHRGQRRGRAAEGLESSLDRARGGRRLDEGISAPRRYEREPKIIGQVT